MGLHLSNSQFQEGAYSRILGTDATLYLNDDWRLGYNVRAATGGG
jgi:hypothetical protein